MGETASKNEMNSELTGIGQHFFKKADTLVGIHIHAIQNGFHPLHKHKDAGYGFLSLFPVLGIVQNNRLAETGTALFLNLLYPFQQAGKIYGLFRFHTPYIPAAVTVRTEPALVHINADIFPRCFFFEGGKHVLPQAAGFPRIVRNKKKMGRTNGRKICPQVGFPVPHQRKRFNAGKVIGSIRLHFRILFRIKFPVNLADSQIIELQIRKRSKGTSIVVQRIIFSDRLDDRLFRGSINHASEILKQFTGLTIERMGVCGEQEEIACLGCPS